MQSPIDLDPTTALSYCDYNKVLIGFQDGNVLLQPVIDTPALVMLHHNSIVSIVDYDRTVIEYLGDSLAFHVPS
jgi:hypothetical protein